MHVDFTNPALKDSDFIREGDKIVGIDFSRRDALLKKNKEPDEPSQLLMIIVVLIIFTLIGCKSYYDFLAPSATPKYIVEHTPTSVFEKNEYKTCLEKLLKRDYVITNGRVLSCMQSSMDIKSQQKEVISKIN